MVNSEVLIGTAKYLTLWTRCHINRCHYKQVLLYLCALRWYYYYIIDKCTDYGSYKVDLYIVSLCLRHTSCM